MESNSSDKAVTMDDASSGNVDADDDKDDNLRAKNNDGFLAKASMTESYSEILNSPIAETNDLPVESNAAPIVIPRRRPSSLNRHHSNQCKWFIASSASIDLFKLTWFCLCFSIISPWIGSGGWRQYDAFCRGQNRVRDQSR